MEEWRIVLLGKQGAGKSSAGNTLLGKLPFRTAASSKGVTHACSKITSTIHGHKISVVDTPGWTDLILMDDETTQEIAKCIDLLEPGPHAFLLVLPIGRFTREEINTAHQILEVFGEEASKYTIVLFTKGDDLEENTIEDFLEHVHPDLKKLLEVCGGRYHVFNNRDKENHRQVFTLLEKIKLMVKRNEGRFYTKAMYQKTADHVDEKWKREKMLKAMMEKQMVNSAVGPGYEAIRRKHSSDMEGAVPERREERVCSEDRRVELERKSVKRNQWNHTPNQGDKYSEHGERSQSHNENFKHHNTVLSKTKGEAEQQRLKDRLELSLKEIDKLRKENHELKKENAGLREEVEGVKLQKVQQGQQYREQSGTSRRGNRRKWTRFFCI